MLIELLKKHSSNYSSLDTVCTVQVSDERDGSPYGMSKKMKNGLTAFIITHRNNEDIDVLFENGIVRKHQKLYDFLNCNISLSDSCKIIPFPNIMVQLSRQKSEIFIMN